MKPNYYAFFDVDGTLIKGKPMLDMLRFYYQIRFNKVWGEILYCGFVLKSRLYALLGENRDTLNRHYYRCYKSQDIQWLKKIGERWYARDIDSKPNAYITNTINEMICHKKNGAEIVLISGSFFACLDPFARRFQIKHILATKLEKMHHELTGEILEPQTIGLGKAKAIHQFLEQQKFSDLQHCYAYGDHVSDIPMLSLVGHPKVIAGDKSLELHAKQHGWQIIYPN